MPGTFHILCGSDEFAVKEAVKKLSISLCGNPPEENPDLEIIRGDSDTVDFQEILDSFINTVTTPPFLSDRKIIWLRHLDFEKCQSEPSDKKKKSRLDHIAGLLEKGLIDGITVLIDGVGADKRKAWFKTVKAASEQEGCSLEWFEKADPKGKGAEAAMSAAAREFAAAEEKEIDESAVLFLVKSMAGDRPGMQNEIRKLATYACDAPRITLEDCHAVCQETEETLSWEFSSALTARNPERAISLIPGILRSLSQGSSSGNPELAIVVSAANEFKRLLSLKCEGEKYQFPAHASPRFFEDLAAKQLENGIRSPLLNMHPYRIFKMWESASCYESREFSRIFDALFQANRAIVTGGGDPRVILETMVLKITRKDVQ